MHLTFQEAARGVHKDLSINVTDTCPSCSGSRSQSGSKPEKCTTCNGTGMETITSGPFIMRSNCRRCHGSRVIIKNPCRECSGKGTTVQRKRVTVPVPAGIEDSQTVRMPVGKKEIFITFRVENSTYFRRDGSDIHTDAMITLSQALLGGTTRIQGIYENVNVEIPPGTGSHSKIRLRGKGIRKVHGVGHGDHYVHVKIKVPQVLSHKQKALAVVLAEMETDTPGTIEGVTKTVGGKNSATTEDNIVRRVKEALDDDGLSEEESPSKKKNAV